MRIAVVFAITLLLAGLASAQSNPDARVSTPEEREGVSLTVYNQGIAIVREVRPLTLARGTNLIRFEGVPAQIDATSLSIKSLTTPEGLVVREQNYQFGLIGTNTVLDAAVGQRIRITRPLANGQFETLDGTLISQPAQGRIVRLDDGRILVDPQGTIELASLPPGLLSRPSLFWTLESTRAATHRTEVSYITRGMGWSADYVLVLQSNDRLLDLTGWVTLTNTSGATFTNANLQLMAGDVRRIREVGDSVVMELQGRAVGAPPAAPPFQQEEFFEYHLYTLDGATTLADRETKQMTLLSATEVPARRRLYFDGSGFRYPVRARPGQGSQTRELGAAVVVHLTNTEANRLGMPMPAGRVRVYQADTRGALQFVGEDRIGHTPRGEELRLYIGTAFDVVGTRTVVERRNSEERISGERYSIAEEVIEVEIRNRKREAVEVAIIERAWGDWSLRDQSHPSTRLDAGTFEFALSMRPETTQTVRFTLRTQSRIR
ncbi:DUF4139 domain-containing protein [soil metagenome]